MSTRSGIAIVNNDGTVESIYCHNDGYPSYMFNMLKDNYSEEEKVKELINLGDLSFVAKYVNPPEGVIHTFDHPYPDVTIAYCRDRGEDYSIHRWNNLDQYLKDGFMFHGVDYLYWYDNNKWSYLEAD